MNSGPKRFYECVYKFVFPYSARGGFKGTALKENEIAVSRAFFRRLADLVGTQSGCINLFRKYYTDHPLSEIKNGDAGYRLSVYRSKKTTGLHSEEKSDGIFCFRE